MKLTDAKLRTLTTPDKTRKVADGSGLYLELTPAGGRYWRMKYRHGGKEKRLALGVYPAVGLKEARDKAEAARKTLQAGDDPGVIRKVEKARTAFETANTLQAVATEWADHQAARWEPATRARVWASLERDIFPSLGARPLASIRPSEIMKAVQKIEARGAGDQAARVLQRIKQVYRWAVTHERIESNPMLDLMPAEILKPREVQHRAALSDRDLPGFLAKLDTYEGDPTTVAALRFLMLTTTRPGEVRGARWSEIDTEAAVWIIPPERMKMRHEHRVPLSRQALQVLETMRPISGGRDLVFPSPFYPSKPLSENTFNSAMARMGYKNTATAHGFRALFSTVMNEADRTLRDVIERQLAHKERDQVRAAYHRSQYIKDRAAILQRWADYLDRVQAGAKVIDLEAHRAA